MTFMDENDSSSTTKIFSLDNNNISAKVWQNVAYHVLYNDITFTSTILLYVNDNTEILTLSNYMFLDTSTLGKDRFVIGAKYQSSSYGSYYNGFLASLEILNTESNPDLDFNECLDYYCLDDCSFGEFFSYDTYTCEPCLDTCEYGCLRESDCILTINPNCTDPISFDWCESEEDEVIIETPAETSSSNTEYTPIAGMSIIVIQGLILGTLFIIYDRKQAEDPEELFKSDYFRTLRFYLLASQFIVQRSGKRLQMVIHLATVLLVELASIGLFHYALDNSTDDGQEGSFSDLVDEYDAKDLVKAAIGLIIGQFVSALL